MKVNSKYIIAQYESGVDSYADYTTEVGLWASEEFTFKKYLTPDDSILDLGCDTGRTTFALHQLGFENIIGLDITPAMIDKAKQLNVHFKTQIQYLVGDAKHLDFNVNQFDAIIFSFNGLMSVPRQSNRNQILIEIQRILKPNGIFIFTTHDRNKEKGFLQFWMDEKLKWKNGLQNKALFEFGDLITTSKNESREIFIHIPSKQEIMDWLKSNNFEVIDTFYRRDRFLEDENVLQKSGECRFWIAKNIKI